MRLPDFLRKYGTRTPGIAIATVCSSLSTTAGWPGVKGMVNAAVEVAQDLTAMLETEQGALALSALGDGRDACEFCLGHKGNAPGNENIYTGSLPDGSLLDIAVCDSCSVLLGRLLPPKKGGVR